MRENLIFVLIIAFMIFMSFIYCSNDDSSGVPY